MYPWTWIGYTYLEQTIHSATSIQVDLTHFPFVIGKYVPLDKFRKRTAESSHYQLLMVVKFQGTFLHRHRLASMATAMQLHAPKRGLVILSMAPDKETHCYSHNMMSPLVF